ncbi:nitrilase-related carbon-nitrogen hydrolase [Paraburkholderia sp. EB58]|uniref:nitrilase-related carbon-nitrogen hydrolase n=1 Tax=Paraburkholderia sp. EB58 TaxID=3035125 RepID=UPI003D1B1106
MSSMSVPTLRVASIPLRSRRGEAMQNVAHIAQWLALSAREAIGLVVFPETCLAGYGSLVKLHRDELEALAEPLDGPSLGAVADAVERTGVGAGVGLIERAPDGRLFNSYVVCMPGGIRHCHRKLHAFEHRRIVSGDRFTVFDTVWGVRIGVLIGGDAYLVENVRMTALMGATLLVVPHRSYATQRGGGRAMQPVSAEQWQRRDSAAGGVTGLATRGGTAVGEVGAVDGRADGNAAAWLRAWLPARAADNGMFVVLSDGLDAVSEGAGSGAAMIVDPCGRILAESAGAGGEESAIVSAGIDPHLIDTSAGRQWLKARRPDLYAPLGRADHQAASFEPRAVSARGSIALSFAQVSRNRLPR